MVAPELVRSAQAGDRDAFITLLREIESHVYRTAYYILNNEQDALDASQEALIRIYTKINSYEEKALFTSYEAILQIGFPQLVGPRYDSIPGKFPGIFRLCFTLWP